MKQIVLATHNRDKAEEFRRIFSDLGVEILTLDAFPALSPVQEDAETLEENALKKAQEVFQATGIPSVADDTGLEVRYLNNEPGVYSSRYAGPGAGYADNVRKLLRNLRGVPPRRRHARFRCVLAFVPSAGVAETTEGICRGVIIEQPRGELGFGYDPVFLPGGYHQTFSEMDISLKNSISHRGRAAQTMKLIITKHLIS